MVDAAIPSVSIHDQAIEVAHSNVIQSSKALMSPFDVCINFIFEIKDVFFLKNRKANLNGRRRKEWHYLYSAPHPLTNDMRIVHIRVNW